MSLLRTDLRPTERGHAGFHNDERKRINALGVLIEPSATASTNVTNIAAAIASVTDGSGNMGTVTLGAGVWDLDGAAGIEIRGKAGGTLQGVGEATVLRWKGNADGTVIKVVCCQRMRVCNLSILASSAAQSAIHLEKDSVPGGFAPTKTQIERVRIDGRANGHKFTFGVLLYGTVSGNNDFNTFDDMEIIGYSHSGFRLIGTQAYNNVIRDCHCFGAHVGQYGLSQQDGANVANVSWYGGSMWANTVCDFYLGRHYYAPNRIVDVNSEGSEMFIHVPHFGDYTLIVDGCRFSADQCVNNVLMDLNGRGLITVQNCYLGDGTNPNEAHVIKYTPDVTPYFAPRFRFLNNRVYSTAESIWSDASPEEEVGTEVGTGA